MKTPKLLAAVPILALSASAVIAWSAVTRASQPGLALGRAVGADLISAKPVTPAEKEMAARRIARMEEEQKRIADRLGMSAPMEIELVNGIDPVTEALNDGFIVEATLEEVEAALAKAAATPETTDDVEAYRLAHRGSYRYFEPEAEATTPR